MSTLLSPTTLSPGCCRCAHISHKAICWQAAGSAYPKLAPRSAGEPAGCAGAWEPGHNTLATMGDQRHSSWFFSQRPFSRRHLGTTGTAPHQLDTSPHLCLQGAPPCITPKLRGSKAKTSIPFASLGTGRVKIAVTSVQTEPHFGVTLLQASQLLCEIMSLWVQQHHLLLGEKLIPFFLSLKCLIFMRYWASHLFYERAFGVVRWIPQPMISQRHCFQKSSGKLCYPKQSSLKGNGVFWTPSFTCGDPDRAFAWVYTRSSGQQPSSGDVVWDSDSRQVVGRTKRLSRRSTCPKLPQPLQCVSSPHVTEVGPSLSRWPRITFGRGPGQTAETAAALAKSICRHESEP